MHQQKNVTDDKADAERNHSRQFEISQQKKSDSAELLMDGDKHTITGCGVGSQCCHGG